MIVVLIVGIVADAAFSAADHTIRTRRGLTGA